MNRKSRQLFRLAQGLLLLLPLSSAALPVQAQETRVASRNFDSYGDIRCDDVMAHLDNFAVALAHEPDAQGYMIVHPGRKLPGRALPHLSWPKSYLHDTRDVEESRVTVVRGDDRDVLRVELLILPKSAPPPLYKVSGEIGRVTTRKPLKFDEGWAELSYYQGEPAFWSDTECPLGIRSLKNFARAARASGPDTRTYFIIYTQFGRSRKSWRGVARQARREMIKLAIRPALITSAYGGRYEYPRVEMWLVPVGTPLPKATPGRRGQWQ